MASAGRPQLRPTVSLMGVELDNVSEDEMLDHVFSSLSAGHGGWAASLNVDILRQTVAIPELRRLMAGADLVLADGMPMLWAGRLQGTPVTARVPTSEAIYSLSERAARRGTGVFFLGGNPGTAEATAAKMAARYAGLVTAHACPPMGFEKDPAAMGDLVATLENSNAGIVFCALGCPKQERLMDSLRTTFPEKWFFAAGGTFSMIAGEAPKAPAWMRKAGLEWAHRLRLEPRRLFVRYVVHDVPFCLRLMASSAAARRGGAGARGANEQGAS
jgi:N-acetylglucosaminyldiphosphoundecaprenol N-acetyl-beta-D-mannosaminyltransferase